MAVKRIAVPGAIAQIAIATLLGVGLASLLSWSLLAASVFGLSLVALLRALEARDMLESPEGKIAVGGRADCRGSGDGDGAGAGQSDRR